MMMFLFLRRHDLNVVISTFGISKIHFLYLFTDFH